MIEGMSVYKIDDTWAQYGYRELYTRWYGKTTGEKIIVRNGEFVRTVSDDYVLVPNEVVRDVVDEIAAGLGARKVGSYEEGWRIYLLYDLEEEYDVEGSTVRLGFYVQNSVDGKLSLAANVQNLIRDPKRGTARIMMPLAMKVLAPTKIVGVYKKRHRVGELDRDVEAIRRDLSGIISRSRESLPLYKFWRTVAVDQEDLKYLWKHIPAIYLPPYIKAMSEGVTLKEMISVWDVIVDIAKAIWNGDCSINRKYTLYRALLEVAKKNR
jgi:hypothetical protein